MVTNVDAGDGISEGETEGSQPNKPIFAFKKRALFHFVVDTD